MPYQIDSSLWSGVFAVPGQIVDEHLKLCGAAALKALLLVLRHGGKIEADEIASFLSLPLADVLDALNYWIHLGVLRDPQSAQEPQTIENAVADTTLVYTFPEPRDMTEEAPKSGGQEPEAAPGGDMQKPGSFRRRLTTRQIGEMSQSDENIAYLLQEAQAVLGCPLTPVATDTVTSLYSYYGMLPDLVLMLLGYCAKLGKTSMRYVEKVACGWIEQGIDTHEKAESEIIRALGRDKSEQTVRRMLGIHDRALISKEKEYLHNWLENLGCSFDLIQLAYERTIELKGKLSFAYMNGILQNWYESSIKTPKQALDNIQSGRGKKPVAALSSGNGAGASYDLGELENLTYRDLSR